MSDKTFKRFVISLTVLAVGIGLLVLARRHSPSVSQPSQETTSAETTSASPQDRPSRPVHVGTAPALPTVEPQSDRQKVTEVQALENAKPEEAHRKLQEAVKSTDDPAVVAVATTLAGRLPADQASPILSDIVAKGNAPPDAYKHLAEALASQGKTEEACRIYSEGMTKHPMEFSVREAYARYLVTLKRSEQAAGVCLKDILLDGDTRSNALRRLILAGEIQWEAGQKDQARATWERLVFVAETKEEGERYYSQVLERFNVH